MDWDEVIDRLTGLARRLFVITASCALIIASITSAYLVFMLCRYVVEFTKRSLGVG